MVDRSREKTARRYSRFKFPSSSLNREGALKTGNVAQVACDAYGGLLQIFGNFLSGGGLGEYLKRRGELQTAESFNQSLASNQSSSRVQLLCLSTTMQCCAGGGVVSEEHRAITLAICGKQESRGAAIAGQGGGNPHLACEGSIPLKTAVHLASIVLHVCVCLLWWWFRGSISFLISGTSGVAWFSFLFVWVRLLLFTPRFALLALPVPVICFFAHRWFCWFSQDFVCLWSYAGVLLWIVLSWAPRLFVRSSEAPPMVVAGVGSLSRIHGRIARRFYFFCSAEGKGGEGEEAMYGCCACT